VIGFLALFVPVIGLWDDRRLRRWLADGWPNARVTSYRQIIILEWTAAIGMLVWWMVERRPVEPLFLTWQISGWRLFVAVLAAAGAAGILIQTKRTVKNPAELAKVRDAIGSLEIMVPRTAQEVTTFKVMAITAGVCEEIMYRGVLQAVLASLFGWWLAVVIGGVIFGLGHIYQGTVGFFKTGLLGMFMSVLTIFTGTLIPAILLHAVIDLTSGAMMTEALRDDD